jgi:sugar phosphate isomerase/epimerase
MGTLKIGVALWSLGPTATEDQLRRNLEQAAEIGFKGVQPWAVDFGPEHPCVLDPDRCVGEKRREMRRLIESYGFTITGFCAQLAGPTKFGGLNEEEGLLERVEKTKRCLELAADMGGPVVTTHPGEIPADRDDPVYRLMLKAIGDIAKHAEMVGAYFCIETGQEPAQVLRQFIEDVGSPNLKVNYDPANMLRWGTVEGVKVLAPWIVHTHAKDWNPETRRATLGQGLVPWEEYVKALKEIGYDGWFAIEDETGVDVLSSLREGKEFLERF